MSALKGTEKNMAFAQDDKTKSFIDSVKMLIDQGKAKDYADIVHELGWYKSSMSAVINGKSNVPGRVARELNRLISEKGNWQTRITDLTKAFIKTVEDLIRNNQVKNQGDLADRLQWNDTGLSFVLNEKRNVPEPKAYQLFRLMQMNSWEDKFDYSRHFNGLSKPAEPTKQPSELINLIASVKVALSLITELKSQVMGKSMAEITAEIERDIKAVEHVMNNNNQPA